MSSALYDRRVYFNGATGCVKVPGLYRSLSRPPRIPGLPALAQIDFAPEVHCTELQAHMGERREMTAAEVQAVHAWLIEVQAGTDGATP